MRSFILFGLVFVLMISGCHCGKKPDEQILLERIDTTSVHLYLATKVAIIKSDASPEAAEAKRQLVAALESLARINAQLQRGTAAAPSGSAAAPPSGAAEPASGTIPASATSASPAAPAHGEVSAADLAKLAKAIWGLKKQGAALVKGRREDELPPILPVLAGDKLPPDLLALLDTNTEHGIFLMTLFALKFHPKTPIPVPPEILLYEAWMAQAEAMKLPGMNVPVRAVKSVVYAQNELCDLSAAEASGLDAETRALTPAMINTSFTKLGASKSQLTDKDTIVVSAAARALSHGATAACYFKRKEKEKALESLGKFVESAHEMGVPPSETALIRAYLAYQKKDYEVAKSCLEEAKSDPSVDAETKKQIEALTADFTEKDDTAIGKFFDDTYFSVLCVKLVLLRLERSGLFNEVMEASPIKTARDYLFAATKVISSAKESVPSVDDARKLGSDLLDGLKK